MDSLRTQRQQIATARGAKYDSSAASASGGEMESLHMLSSFRRNVRCIAHVMTPVNLLAALCAFETIKKETGAAAKLTIVLQQPYADDEATNEIAAVLREISSSLGEQCSLVVLTQSEFVKFVDDRPTKLRKLVGDNRTRYIIYSHDMSGECVGALAESYPEARLVCTGDGFGTLTLKDHHLKLLGVEPSTVEASAGSTDRSLIRSWFDRYPVRRRKAGSFVPDRFILVIPIDHCGDLADEARLTVCDRSVAKGVIRIATSACRDLNSYINQLRSSHQRCCILLPDNFADAGWMTIENESQLLIETIRSVCEPGSTIIVKPHPNASIRISDYIVDGLGSEYNVVETDHRFRRFPIELWFGFLEEHPVIAPGHAMITLKYFFNKDVIQPFTTTAIAEFVPPKFFSFFTHAVDLTMAPLLKLNDWDGRSMLYIGKKPVELVH